jgi:flagellar motility protein MotE (MotC chaperone)
MAWGSKKSGGGGPAWLALLVALVALWIAWSAYRRTGGSLDTLVANPLEAPKKAELPAEAEEGDWRAALDRARERLLSRRDEVQEDRDLEAVQRDIADIRATLEKAWHGAGEAKEKWQDLDAELERLQRQVRDGSTKAKETLDGVVQKMKNAT